MNRTIYIPAARTQPTFGDWVCLLFACLQYFFAQREVKMGLRIFFGGGAFLATLVVVGGIECGTVALMPGGLLCLGLLVAAFLLLRRLSVDG